MKLLLYRSRRGEKLPLCLICFQHLMNGSLMHIHNTCARDTPQYILDEYLDAVCTKE